jgi:hypothetical protein
MDVGVAALQAGHLLSEPMVRLRHQVALAARPVFVAIGDNAFHTETRRLHRVLAHRFGMERRQIAMPVDALSSLDGSSRTHLMSFV